ncbi:MAG: SPOR domain-containing protein [Luteimonas sp.]
MAVKRGRSQARRSGGNPGGLPGWAWMILGIVLTIVVVLAAPKFLKGDGEDGFFRPRPNPDARPAMSAVDDADEPVVPDSAGPAPAATASGETPAETQYDFYTLLPGEEVALTDAQIAASARAEEARQRELARQQADPDAADLAQPATAAAPSAASTAATTTPSTTTGNLPVAGDDARYLLQAGSFSGSGDAEALKARIALLGLSARVETAEINGRIMYRVRMGPYGTASELAEAKQKLGNGGLPALAIKAR